MRAGRGSRRRYRRGSRRSGDARLISAGRQTVPECTLSVVTRGDLREAIRHLEAFFIDWSDLEPAVQPQVQAVRARVAVLRERLAPG